MAAIMIGTVIGKINKGTVNWLDNARLEKIAPESNCAPFCKQYNPRQNRDTRTDEAWVRKAGNVTNYTLLYLLLLSLILRPM